LGKIEFFQGRPKENEGRLMKEIRVYDFLDSLHIDYFRTDHEPAETMDDCRRIGVILGCRICKNLFLTNKQHTEYYLLMMPGDKPFKTKELSPQLHVSRLSFAEPEELASILDTLPGSASVMGLLNDKENRVQLVIDEDVTKGHYIGCHPCVNTTSLKIRTRDMIEKVLPALSHKPIRVKLVGE
jgi:Ala-tRNA(Pro) deacylase